MEPRRNVKEQKSKPSRYRLPILEGVAGVLLLVIGFTIPVQGWNVALIFLGFILLFAAAFSIQVGVIGDWIPGLFAKKEPDDKDNFPPPPPTLER